MKTSHIAIIGHAMPPHVGPTLPVVAALTRRGHRVTYATSSKFSDRVAASGAEVIEIPIFQPFSQIEESEKRDFQHPYCREAIQTLRLTTSFYEKDRPDVVMYDIIAFAGRILANRLKIPAIQMSPLFAFQKQTLAPLLNNQAYFEEVLEVGARAGRFLEHHGITGGEFLYHREKLNIYFVPMALQPDGDVFGKACFHAGRCAGEQPYYGNWTPAHTGGRPIALVSTSTAYVRGPGFFRMCLQALSGLGLHIILSIGDQVDAAALNPLPPHCEVVQGVSHVRILPHVRLFICLGGNMTAAEAAYHGVPLIVTSHGFPELEYQGDNIVRVGLGLHLREHEMTENSLRQAAIRALEDEEFLEGAGQIRKSVRREPGGEETANRIEDYLDAWCR